jgi:hypothetical protein
MRVLIILFFLCCGSFTIAFGQKICFDEQLSEGDTYLKQGLPQKAIDSWNAAIKQCDLTTSQRATLNSRIKSADNARGKLPPETKTPSVKAPQFEYVLVKPESKRIVTVPATYETVTEQVMVKPESKRIVEVPATYETVTERYEIEPKDEKVEVLSPKFETVTEKIMVTPATTKWVKKPAAKECLSADPNDCLVWCLVEVPAEYKTVTKQVNKGCDGTGVANSGCVKKTSTPAKTATRTVQKIKTPATTREEVIPAQYATVTKQKVKTPATTREEIIPAEYKTVPK